MPVLEPNECVLSRAAFLDGQTPDPPTVAPSNLGVASFGERAISGSRHRPSVLAMEGLELGGETTRTARQLLVTNCLVCDRQISSISSTRARAFP